MSLDVLKNVLLSLNQTILEFVTGRLQHHLSIGVWNVNGLVSKDFDKLNDVSFFNCIKNLDVVGVLKNVLLSLNQTILEFVTGRLQHHLTVIS
jgi:hypothetical protein